MCPSPRFGRGEGRKNKTMHQLLPIIRRKRRTLIVEAEVPSIPTKDLADGHQAVPVQPIGCLQGLELVKISKADDGKGAAKKSTS
jgi:hypothetical protein